MMGMELPATAYVLDLINQRAVAEVMSMIQPVLESRHVVKVGHSSLDAPMQLGVHCAACFVDE